MPDPENLPDVVAEPEPTDIRETQGVEGVDWELVAQYPDSGRQWIRITSEEEAAREGVAMKHAVYPFYVHFSGGKAYGMASLTYENADENQARGQADFFSLRETDGSPVATVMNRGGVMEIAVGQSNQNPFRGYNAHLRDLAEITGVRITERSYPYRGISAGMARTGFRKSSRNAISGPMTFARKLSQAVSFRLGR